MNVIYETSVLDQIKDVICISDCIGKKIQRIELTTKEMDELVNELGGECPRVNFCPRTVTFKQFNVVEVFNAK